MTNEVSTHSNTTLSLVANTNLEQVSNQLKAIDNFQMVVQKTLRVDQDYGTIPGTNKPTLLKPGAEKILMLMGLTSEYEIVDKVENYTEGFFAYTVKSSLYKDGLLITEGFGSANTKETRYRQNEWNEAEHKKIWNGGYQDPYTLVNTVLKMAKKRAQVDAALTVGSLSNVFTQDIEDMKELLDKEQMETMNDKDANNMKITFGKYKGQTLVEVLKKDRSYIEWISKNAKQDSLKKAASMLLEGKNDPKSFSNSKNNDEVKSISKEQIGEINNLASIIGAANELKPEEVIKAYKIDDLALIDHKTALDLIKRLTSKLDSAMEKQSQEFEQEELFNSSKPPLSGREIDISDDDLPF
ncbi:hypothetical protein [Enterococcus pallens]|uniref:Exodeoxyribonuclease X-like C-terminal domain-containing protein n=1 Tax=Enterococcus pallens ATCC BAA-351 TaxID=1158607 RepID=R2PQA7_9ENTE|nr:hypothetical protein [Enterococcus pallens]EOH86732.1 hypothetical protein UAU_05178 [Enterococcus pallens ATCC BAA-351]EOU18528.1 hypothetical protein I588_03523 [Enterococcus pallens ATCC BAA-351]